MSEITAKLVVTSENMISEILFKQEDLDRANARGVLLVNGNDIGSIIKVAASDAEYDAGLGTGITTSREGSSGLAVGTILAIILGAFAFFILAFLAFKYLTRWKRTSYATLDCEPPGQPQQPQPQMSQPAYLQQQPAYLQQQPTPQQPTPQPTPQPAYLQQQQPREWYR